MTKRYIIVHEYDEDGGFGDAVPVQDVIGGFDDIEKAKAYVEKWSKPFVYERPYDALYAGEIRMLEVDFNTLDIDKDPLKGSYFRGDDNDENYENEDTTPPETTTTEKEEE